MLASTFETYKGIKWADIDTDGLTDECKKLAKVVRAMDKIGKNWGCEGKYDPARPAPSLVNTVVITPAQASRGQVQGGGCC